VHFFVCDEGTTLAFDAPSDQQTKFPHFDHRNFFGVAAMGTPGNEIERLGTAPLEEAGQEHNTAQKKRKTESRDLLHVELKPDSLRIAQHPCNGGAFSMTAEIDGQSLRLAT